MFIILMVSPNFRNEKKLSKLIPSDKNKKKKISHKQYINHHSLTDIPTSEYRGGGRKRNSWIYANNGPCSAL